MKSAFITGVTGQDGYYLSKLLLEKDYSSRHLEDHQILILKELMN